MNWEIYTKLLSGKLKERQKETVRRIERRPKYYIKIDLRVCGCYGRQGGVGWTVSEYERVERSRDEDHELPPSKRCVHYTAEHVSSSSRPDVLNEMLSANRLVDHNKGLTEL